MPFTYADFRDVLHKAGFLLVRSKKHETWEKVLPDGTILQVRVSHQHGRDIPVTLFHRMLRQAHLTTDDFVRILKSYSAKISTIILGRVEAIAETRVSSSPTPGRVAVVVKGWRRNTPTELPIHACAE